MNTNKLIIEKLIAEKIKDQKKLSTLKRKTAKNHKISLVSNVELLKSYHNLVKNKEVKANKTLEWLLRKRKIRSLSGVVVVSVLTKPWFCPGKCIFCPTEKGLPKSYLSGEPAVERAKNDNFNPYLQTKNRLESLEIQGHPIDKIELRIIGGSFTYYPKQYQTEFIKECFRAVNEFQKKQKFSIKNHRSQRLENIQKRNEKAKHKIVGISIETRPDLIDEKEILNLRKLGITMVELGVQTTYDDILKKCQRGHSLKETVKATKLLKNAGFKIMYQIMPNLPNSNLERDFECFKTIFRDQRLKPDWLKIYPCVVCKKTKLYQIWKKQEYHSYTDKEIIELLIKIKSIMPYWIRIARLFRDIPVKKIESGSKFSNLRQIIQKEMKKTEKTCNCIRCREVKEKYNPKEKIYLFQQDYNASEGKEIFLSFENKKQTKLFSLLRLRFPQNTDNNSKHAIPALKNTALIREIHTYGQMARISEKCFSPQHRGLGKKLIKQAEKISKKFGVKKIAVISGIGVRPYYRKLGYRLKDTYMIKVL